MPSDIPSALALVLRLISLLIILTTEYSEISQPSHQMSQEERHTYVSFKRKYLYTQAVFCLVSS